VKPPPFEYTRAASLKDALDQLAVGDDVRVLAGGQSLVPLMNFRLARPARLVDINALDELNFVRLEPDGGLVLGALLRHAALGRRPELTGPWNALSEAAPLIGHYPIRVRGTAGGSIAHADPAAELPAVCEALDAEMVALSRRGRRVISAREFFTGPFATALAADELLIEVVFPAPPVGAVSVFDEFSERAGDFALAAVCAAVRVESGKCDWARLALGGVGPTPLRATVAEGVLVGSALDAHAIEQAAAAAAAACEPRYDFHGSARFRFDLVHALTRRALSRAVMRAGTPAGELSTGQGGAAGD
jgi:carbon-monoxide dehydrogenase medium subunit/6-hydroxypseudooxynicotine dehydrogenase subunit alpha